MATRKGYCRNIDGCELAEKHEIQEVDASDFVCKECHEPLHPVAGNKRRSPLPLIIGGVCGVVAVGALLFFVLRTPESEQKSENNVVKEAPVVSATEDEVKPAADSTETEVVATPEESVAASKSAAKEPSVVQDSPKYEEPAHNRLDYGKWSGSWKNGKPHGNGTMTYTVQHVIDSRDPKGRVAQPNEYIIGEWDNGRLVQGRWFKSDGTKEVIIIGKAG